MINNGAHGGAGNRQTPNITLSANATIGGTGNIYMINGGYACGYAGPGRIHADQDRQQHALPCNTTVTAGTISIASGTVSQANVAGNASAAHVTLADTAGAALALGGFNLTIASLSGGGTTGGNVSLGGNTLTVSQSTNTTYGGAMSGTGG